MQNTLADITAQNWILALFIRDDGERFLLGSGAYEFKKSLQHFQPNTYANDIVELQGTDGQLLAGQVRRTAPQPFDGYIADQTMSQQMTESRRRAFLMFFRKKHFYTVAYIMPDGSAIQRRRGYITDAPAVSEMIQRWPEYHVALNFEDPNYYEYAEDSDGNPTYAHVVDVLLASASIGGLMWDADGVVWDSNGAIWESGGTGGSNIITVNGVDSVLPVWEVVGPATNPTLTNTTTGQSITWTGIVPNGQSLIIDMAEQTATMAGANVFQFVDGQWIRLDAGNNTLTYTATGATAPSILSWNGVVG